MSVPGLYLILLLVSAAGILVLDLRHRLAFGADARRSALAVGAGVVFFVLWDLAGIATGVFIKGDSPLALGIDLAPHLPIEEPIFLAFLCHLALVTWAAAARLRDSRARRAKERAR